MSVVLGLEPLTDWIHSIWTFDENIIYLFEIKKIMFRHKSEFIDNM